MIGKLLGHNKVQTTDRCAHLANDPVKSAANRISSRIAEFAQQSNKSVAKRKCRPGLLAAILGDIAHGDCHGRPGRRYRG